MRIAWLGLALWLGVATVSAQGGSPTAKPACINPKLGGREDGVMFGRIAAAIEDLGGGYNAEAQRKYASIVRDIEKRDYHPCLRWMTYDGYGQALTIGKKKDKAIAMLTRAAEIAGTLSDSEREESARHLEAAQQLK